MPIEALLSIVLATSLGMNAYFLKQVQDRVRDVEKEQQKLGDRVMKLEWITDNNGGRNAGR